MGGPSSNMAGVLTRGDYDTDTHRGKKMAVCKPRRKASEEVNPANTVRKKFPLLK